MLGQRDLSAQKAIKEIRAPSALKELQESEERRVR